MKYFVILFFLPSLVIGGALLKYDDQPPMIVKSKQSSPDSRCTAILYESSGPIEEGIPPAQSIKINTPKTSWWINLPIDPFDFVGAIEFIDDKHLLIELRNSTREGQAILDLTSKELNFVGSGRGDFIRHNNGKGLIRLRGQKHYFPEGGAFWVDVLVDKEGNVVEVLSAPKGNGRPCVPLNLILDDTKPHPKLRQTLDQCVYVER